MATLGGIELDTVDYPTAFAFWLTSKCSFDVQRGADHSAIVRLTKGMDFAVVRFKQTDPAENLFKVAKKLANETLDFLCFSYCEPLLLKNSDEEYFSVSSESSRTKTLTYRTTCPLPMRLAPLRITVRDKDGNEINQPKVKPAWSPVLHYYRISQSRDNIFDAYRYMFLAFEVILQILCPIKNSEGEQRWMTRALNQIGHDVDLTKFAIHASASTAISIVEEQYKRIRLPLFHSKKSTTIPYEGLSETCVLAAYKPLTNLVREVISHYMGIRGGQSTFVNSFIQKGFEAIVNSDIRMAATSENIDHTDDHESTDSKLALLYFDHVYLAPEQQPYQRDVIGETKITDAFIQKSIQTIGFFKKSAPYLISTLDVPLNLISCDHLRVVFSLRHVNLGRPRWT